MATLTLSSTLTTGQYVRTLPVYTTAPSPNYENKNQNNVYNQYIAPNLTGAKNQTVNAMVLGAGDGFTDSVAPNTYISNNKTSGITFLVFNRVTNIKGVNLNVGPSNGSGSTQDFGDSVYIETGDHSTGNNASTIVGGVSTLTKPVNFIGSTIITGDETSPTNDNDLVVFGSDQSQDGQTYSISQGSFKATINGLQASSSTPATQSPLTLQSSTVQTGNGNDSLIFANTNPFTKIGGSAGEGNLFDLGEGSDVVYFAAPNTIYGNNVINIGKKDGSVDGQADSLVFNGTNFTNLNGTTAYLQIKGFQNTKDSLFYNGVQYQDKTTISTATGNKIQFA